MLLAAPSADVNSPTLPHKSTLPTPNAVPLAIYSLPSGRLTLPELAAVPSAYSCSVPALLMCAVTPVMAAELMADATPVIVVAPVVTAVPLRTILS